MITSGNRKIISTGYDVAIGGWGYGKYRMVEGVIDEVKIYNVALTPQEILTDAFGESVIVESKMVNPNEEFTVNIAAHLTERPLHGFSFNLVFDPTILQAIRIKEGAFLSGDAAAGTIWKEPQVDNEKGVITDIECHQTAKSSITENTGVLAIATFKAIKAGGSKVGMQKLRLFTPHGEAIAARVREGSVAVFPSGGISGVVINALSKAPIPGVRISVSNGRFGFQGAGVSDEKGEYAVNGVPIGNVDVDIPSDSVISKSEYLPVTATAETHVRAGEMTGNVNLELKLKPIPLPPTPPAPPPVTEARSLIGQRASDFTLKDLNGNSVSLSDFKGKAVVLNFWATWSQPCRRKIPHMDALYNTYKDEGLVVIGINKETDHTEVRAVAKEQISYPILLDGHAEFEAYNIRAIPCTYYIDKEGVVRYRDVGFGSGGEREIEEKIRQLLQ